MTYQGQTVSAAGRVDVPGAQPPPVLLAALGPAMLGVAGRLADGTVTWMTGPRTICEHVVPAISKAASAAGRPAPRVIAGFLVCVTSDPGGARERIAQQFGIAGQVPEYRAVAGALSDLGEGEPMSVVALHSGPCHQPQSSCT